MDCGPKQRQLRGNHSQGGTDGFLIKVSSALTTETTSPANPPAFLNSPVSHKLTATGSPPIMRDKSTVQTARVAPKSMCDGFASDSSAKVTYTESGAAAELPGSCKNCDIYIPLGSDEKIYSVSFIGSGFTADKITCTKYSFGSIEFSALIPNNLLF